jgi:hypothetical protein
MRVLTSLRQLKYPKEFRICPVVWPVEIVSVIEQLLQRPEPSSLPTQVIELPKEQMRFLADVGTGLWRLRQKMVDPSTNRPLEEMRRAFRHLESVWDALTQAGVEILDHTGDPYDSGLSIKVIAFQPTAGMVREKVVETIKPTVYFKGQPIQMGEVIVATPESVGNKEG